MMAGGGASKEEIMTGAQRAAAGFEIGSRDNPVAERAEAGGGSVIAGKLHSVNSQAQRMGSR